MIKTLRAFIDKERLASLRTMESFDGDWQYKAAAAAGAARFARRILGALGDHT